MRKEHIKYWLALARTPNVGPKLFKRLIESVDDVTEVFSKKFITYLNTKPEVINGLKNPDWKGVERDIDWLEASANHHFLTIKSPGYPQLLLEIPDPPPILFICGRLDLLESRQIAIIGTRKPTPTGEETAFEFAKALSEAGLTITSGLAAGIDAFAHKGALARGNTIAVIGTGPNLFYPKKNQALAEEICKQGAMMSEFPVDTPPRAENFPRRNRIVSGLSVGALVVEGNLKSGSLITANYSNDFGRDVFAVPGSINNPLAKGCHHLIKQGAKLVEQVEDILDEYNIPVKTRIKHHEYKEVAFKNKLDAAHLKLLECIGYEPAKIDVLIARSHFTVQKIATILMDLEEAGYVRSLLNGYTRVPE